MKCQFFLNYHTNYGDSLWFSGDQNFLGTINENGLLPLEYLSANFWRLEIEIPDEKVKGQKLEYKYLLRNRNGEFEPESNYKRVIDFSKLKFETIKIYDEWNFAGAYQNVFYTSPFENVLLPIHKKSKTVSDEPFTHIFKIKYPLLAKDEVICMVGDGLQMGNWDTKNPMLLGKEGDGWTIKLNLHHAEFPMGYKYGVFDKKKKEFVRFEEGDNRICFDAALDDECIIMQDGFARLPNNTWKGAGVAIPVFSLRSKESFGIGEFTDLHLLVDWAHKTGLKMIQLLPINDTTATGTNEDSYPYAAISAFALHPIYINLFETAGKSIHHLDEKLKKKRKHLNESADVKYEEVLHFKMAVLRDIFEESGKKFFERKDFQIFFDENKTWLKPYAAFCYLRDKYKTADSEKWTLHQKYEASEIEQFFQPGSEEYTDVIFHCFVQYHLHLQLKKAVAYAHKKQIILKGDIPIGVYRYGCDAWMSPDLFNMDTQSGAPPDDFAAKGQNWGFPTYNWKRIQADGFAWWRQRFEQMSRYFDAFRIDHILGFFRIWSIPLDAVQGVMGKFDPCIPVHVNEFGENGIPFSYERFCMPFINDQVLFKIFGNSSEKIKSTFIQKVGEDKYVLREEFDTQKKVEEYFDKEEADSFNNYLKNGLYDLIANVIMFEEKGSEKQQFHFRIAMNQTSSYQHLPSEIRERLWHLYINYFFNRQNDFWRKESLSKLPELKDATNMLVCGEDLGMVPECVPDVMRQLGILSLEIQRMPKQTDREFFNPANAPYLSVVTPSTHDMSTIRGWWQENTQLTQRFFNQELRQSGGAPFFCEAWINRAIVMQHLYSPAMWSIFQIQDILGMSEKLRRERPEDERINIPADPNHFWKYRMHITLEQLLKEKEFNEELQGYVKNSGR